MAVTKGAYSSHEEVILASLLKAGLNTAAACGILANLEAEGGFNPKNLQGSYESSLGFTDDTYTSGVDNGSYSKQRFINDEAGYGICQWTYSTRKQALYNYARNTKKTSIGSLHMQIGFLLAELQGKTSENFGTLWDELLNLPNTADGAGQAGSLFCLKFEKPADASSKAKTRASNAKNTYWVHYTGNPIDPDLALDIEEIGNLEADEGYEFVDPNYYTSLTSIDPYSHIMSANLARISAPSVDYDYGYLIDMTNGGEFRFYIPEFTENAGANWSDIDIRGRSVSVKAYESTNSRSISISLDLYAGVGVYRAKSGESGEDTVSRMHQDAFFVKSLEYPDYTTAITRPPATVHLVLGSAINISGVVSDVSVEHLKPLDIQNRAMYLKLSFTVTQTAVNPPDYRDIRKGHYALLDTSNVNTIYR